MPRFSLILLPGIKYAQLSLSREGAHMVAVGRGREWLLLVILQGCFAHIVSLGTSSF